MKAVKGNIQLTISNEAEVKAYRESGFDIIDDAGKVVKYSSGKKISYEEHLRLVEEAVEHAAEEAVAAMPDEKGYIAENKQLKKDLDAANKRIDELEKAAALA